jgi:hypothetical protein
MSANQSPVYAARLAEARKTYDATADKYNALPVPTLEALSVALRRRRGAVTRIAAALRGYITRLWHIAIPVTNMKYCYSRVLNLRAEAILDARREYRYQERLSRSVYLRAFI